jgi:hypothetical protein
VIILFKSNRYLDDECEGEVYKPMPLFGRWGFTGEDHMKTVGES